MFLKKFISIRLIICFVTIVATSGCVSTPPLFTKSPTHGPAVNNEVPFFPAKGSAPFKFQSFGSSENTHERDLKPVTWKKVDEFVAGKFSVALHAKENETNILAHFLKMPHDNIERIENGSKREVLAKVVGEMDVLVRHIFQKKAVRAKVNFYVAIFDTEVKTPITDWQYGPIIDPVELNLAVMLPPLGEKYERESGFDDTRWYEQIMQIALHEYAHVVHNNAPSAFNGLLADEFIAHTVGLCAGYGIHEFRNQALNDSILRAAINYAQDREFITRGKPFATSTTGGELASTALAALFSHNELANAPRERWLEALPQYCKMIVSANPSFTTTNEALDWIEVNIQKTKLPFLAK
jgi:hypothetical protein